MTPRPFLLGGREITTAHTIGVRNPYDRGLLAEVCLAGPAEISKALDMAHRAFGTVRRTPAAERADILRRISSTIARRAGEFAELIVSEAGKPVALAEVEVQRACATFELAAASVLEPPKIVLEMEATAAGAGHTGLASRFPLGVILGITPFNFPLNLAAHKIAPCLATGNTMILKPSPRTPLTALLLAEVLAGCGVPAGQTAILPFAHEHVGALLDDARVKMLTFTGSAAVGWQLKARAPRAKVALELGGNAACVVEPDAEWKKHAAKMVAGAFAYAGQSCISVQRIFVHREIYDAFRSEFLAQTRGKAVAGDPRSRATLVGPMITPEALEQAVARVREAVDRGARLLTPPEVTGNILHPVVMENVPRDAAIAREEAFAPVVLLESYHSFDDALAAVNDSKFGLQAGVFTSDMTKAWRAYDVLEVGGVLINQVPTFRIENMPYGGVKDSGCGREGIPFAMDDMTELKSLVINKSGT